ncbi:MAG: LysR family transcriptional regulator [Deltaproteobacteria bacterium]|nr:LysR family transcriptional regulator [Deltaproteobacteria bacterium]
MRILQQVVILAEARSYARAAKMLHLSQPGLSRSILQLEARIGQRLFDRSRRQIQLTEAGLLFVNRARDLLARGDDLEREVSLLNGSRGGQLNMGAGPYPAELILKPALKTLLSGPQGLRVRVSTDHWLNLVRQLRSGEIDLALAEFSELTGEPDLEIRPLTPLQGYFLGRAGHPLLSEEEPSLQRVLQFPLAAVSHFPSRIMGPMLQGLPESSLRPQVAVITDNLDVIREVVSGTDILGLFTLSQVETELEKGKLVVIPYTAPWLHSQYGLITLKRHNGSPDEETFIRLALEVDEDIKRKEKDLAKKYFNKN